MLMPWPGPHETPEMSMSWLPETMDMQSSPVRMAAPEMRIAVEEPMRIPSVLGLWAGAVIRIWVMLMWWQANMIMWELLLLIDRRLYTLELLTKSNLSVCKLQKKKTKKKKRLKTK